MTDEVDIRELAEEGYSIDEIIDEMKDEGYDQEDIDEAFLELGYDWQDALEDAIRDQLIDLDDADYYADLLDVDISDVFDMYYDYEEE